MFNRFSSINTSFHIIFYSFCLRFFFVSFLIFIVFSIGFPLSFNSLLSFAWISSRYKTYLSYHQLSTSHWTKCEKKSFLSIVQCFEPFTLLFNFFFFLIFFIVSRSLDQFSLRNIFPWSSIVDVCGRRHFVQ